MLAEARRVAAIFAAKSPELMRLGKAAFMQATDNGDRQGAAGAVDFVSTAFVEKRGSIWKDAEQARRRGGAIDGGKLDQTDTLPP